MNLINKIFVFSISLIFIFYIRVYLSIFGFGSLIKLLRSYTKFNFFEVKKLTYVLQSIELASKYIPYISCLVKVAALKLIYNKMNSLKINIGIRIQKGEFKSHAWAVLDKKIILNDEFDIGLYKVIYKI